MGQQIGSFFKSKYTGQQIENMLDSATNIAGQYDPAASYVVGDLVLYSNGLYVCTGATSGTFDPTKWQQTTLDEILTNLGATYTDPNSDGNVVIGVDSTVGEKILRSLTFPGLTNRYYLPFAQYIRERLQNDPSNASFGIEIPDAEEAPLHSTVIKGKTVAVNQLVRPLESTYWDALSGATPTFNNGECTFTASAANIGAQISSSYRNSVVNGHTYYYSFSAKASAATSMRARYVGGLVDSTISATSSWQTNEGIKTATTSGTGGGYVVATEASGATCTFKDYQFIDLTLCGFTSSETTDVATLKSAWLKKFGYPLPDYIPYDAGSLANVNGTYRLCGKNLLDPSKRESQSTHVFFYRNDGFVVEAGKTYTFSTQNITSGNYVRKYPSGENIFTIYGTSAITFTPTETMYVYFDAYWATAPSGGTSDIPFQLELGSPATTYEPYYNGGTIDCSGKPLNGVGTAQDEEDFATGERVTRLLELNFEDGNWTYNSAQGRFVLSLINMKSVNAWNGIGILCGNYKIGTVPSDGSGEDKTLGCYATNIFVRDTAYSDASAFKTANTGKKLVFELATPVTTTETPQPLYTEYGYNVIEPVSGGVQSAEVDAVYYENIAGYIDKKLAEG